MGRDVQRVCLVTKSALLDLRVLLWGTRLVTWNFFKNWYRIRIFSGSMKLEFFIAVLLVMWPAALAQKGCQERCYASEEDWETKCAWTELCSACPRCDTSENPSVKISTATMTTEGSKSG